MTVQLELRNIVKSYGDHQVLADLGLDCGKGEFLIILGPSGCGKTTLLNIVSGIARPDSGHILSNGRAITDLPRAAEARDQVLAEWRRRFGGE